MASKLHIPSSALLRVLALAEASIPARNTIATYVHTPCKYARRRRLQTIASLHAQPVLQQRTVGLRVPASSRFLATQANASDDVPGPIEEYDERVHSHRLRDDDHQRTIVLFLQDLHDMLLQYQPAPIIRPGIDDLKPHSTSWLGTLLGAGTKPTTSLQPPDNLPKGIYMYGDVGSGKTMLMDLFYDTLPSNIKHKTRIHFHNFMQDVHKRMHAIRARHGADTDAILFVAADIAANANVLCFDEFQCTDVADAMILRRLLEALMAHGVVLVTTSNRKPDDLYKNGIQRVSFVPCITLLNTRLRVINLDSDTDYRKMPRPPSGVYHHPLDAGAKSHADKWFGFLGDPAHDPPHRAVHEVWGRQIVVPKASGRAAMFTFDELLGRATGAADYIELAKNYGAFIVTDVPGMSFHQRDLARRFITFIDAVYESKAKLVLTSAVPLPQLFMSSTEIETALDKAHANATTVTSLSNTSSKTSPSKTSAQALPSHTPNPKAEGSDFHIDTAASNLMSDADLNAKVMKGSGMFGAEEEVFAFTRALSRLSEMGSLEWVERGLGMEKHGGKGEREGWGRVRSRWREDMG